MTDKEKLDAIRAEIHRLVDVRGYDRGMANDLFAFMDSLPNEPISNDLEQASYHEAMKLINDGKFLLPTTTIGEQVECFKKFYKAGAEWQKEQMMKGTMDGKISRDNYLVGPTQWKIAIDPEHNVDLDHSGLCDEDWVKFIIVN